MEFGGETQQLASPIGLVYGYRAGADPEIPSSELHVRGRLTGIEHNGPAICRVRGEDDNCGRSPRKLLCELTELRQFDENFPILRNNEVPGLAVLCRLGATPRIYDRC